MNQDSAFSRRQVVGKPVAHGDGGVAVAPNRVAAEQAVAVLAAGGNAADAAVVAALCLGVLEPWAGGLGGGGSLILQPADDRLPLALDFGVVAPQALRTDRLPTAAVEAGFGRVGAAAALVPGLIDGLAQLLERFGTLTWEQALAPARALAEEGVIVDWYLCLMVAVAAVDLARDPDARAIFLPGGQPPVPDWLCRSDTGRRIRMPGLAACLATLAEEGPRSFYEGSLARRLAADLARQGSCVTLADLAAYRARWLQPLCCRYRDATVFGVPGPGGGGVLAEALGRLPSDRLTGERPGSDAYGSYARTLMGSFATPRGLAEPDEAAYTTQLCIADRHGMQVVLAQSLVSLFGARVVLPDTGLLINNGLIWFDPHPGRPNAVAPGKQPAGPLRPTLLQRGASHFAFGAGGGRRVLPALLQLVSFLVDYRMSLEEAIRAPRIDLGDDGVLVADSTMPMAVLAELARPGERLMLADHTVYPPVFGCPTLIEREAHHNRGAADPWHPRAEAIAV